MAGPVASFPTWSSKLRLKWGSSIFSTLKTKENTTEVEAALRTAAFPIADIIYGHSPITEASSVQHPPIDRLPTELLLHIFHYGNPAVKYCLRLTHVCRRWREIAIEGGSLWTSIDIIPDRTASDENFNKFISLLDLQFGRTRNFPLDVVWHIHGSRDRTAVIIKHIRQNGPFHRWRSLTLSALSTYHPIIGDFPNLESLIILPVHSYRVLRLVNSTTTSRLRTLDISLSGTHDRHVGYRYGAMLNNITRLVLPSTDVEKNVVMLPPFPANIVDIEADKRSTHPFPYVKTYKLTHGIFREDYIIDLQRLTTLIITNSFAVHESCPLVLPSLRRLACGYITLGENAVMDAPELEVLEFWDEVHLDSDFTRTRFGYIEDILHHPGYLLSPAKSLSLNLPLPADLIVTMMSRCSRLENLALRFNADLTVWRFIVAIMGDTEKSGIICPQLTEIRFRFAWGYRDFHGLEWWKDRAAQIVRGRTGIPAVLNIYGAWDEGETFTLLS